MKVMTLRQLCNVTDDTRASFAKRVGLTPDAMSHLIAGRRRIGPRVAARIAEATNTVAIVSIEGDFLFRTRRKDEAGISSDFTKRYEAQVRGGE